MGMRIEEEGRSCRAIVDGDVTVATAAEIQAALSVAVREHDETEVDLAGVEEMDTAGLQIILAAKRCAGKTVRFVNHSAAVLRVLELANLGQQLGDPLLIRASDAAADGRT
ncbi:MAG: STAS domain-containing protein [Rhodocyclales bacterium]|nr:STAS domain-containing protein [Rhodocyclales bacterium]